MRELIEALRREQQRNERLAKDLAGDSGRTHPMVLVHLAIADTVGNVAAELEDGPPDEDDGKQL